MGGGGGVFGGDWVNGWGWGCIWWGLGEWGDEWVSGVVARLACRGSGRGVFGGRLGVWVRVE